MSGKNKHNKHNRKHPVDAVRERQKIARTQKQNIHITADDQGHVILLFDPPTNSIVLEIVQAFDIAKAIINKGNEAKIKDKRLLDSHGKQIVRLDRPQKQ